ncbi:MAG: hypothetical protein ACRC1Z_17255 [Waterburya sp.]
MFKKSQFYLYRLAIEHSRLAIAFPETGCSKRSPFSIFRLFQQSFTSAE